MRELADKQKAVCSEQQEDCNTYVILDIHVLNELFESAKGRDCGEKSLKVKLSSNVGLATQIDLVCDFCEQIGNE